MPDPNRPTDDEVVRLLRTYVGNLRRRVAPTEVDSSVMDRIHLQRRGARVGLVATSVVVIVGIAAVAGIALAVHVGRFQGPTATSGDTGTTPTGTAAVAWRTVSTPSGFAPSAISCPSSGECSAVGGSTVWRYSNGAWTLAGSSGPDTSLDGVTCLSSGGDCWVVGQQTEAPATGTPDAVLQPLIEQDAGAGLTVVNGPAVVGDTDSLSAVTCVTEEDCWAVGVFGTDSQNGGDGLEHPLIEHYDGAAWTVVSSAKPLINGSLSSVACVGANECWAVGSTSDGVLIENYSGAAWSVTVNDDGAGGGTGLGRLMCVSASDCWAVGGTFGVGVQPLIEHYSTGAWALVASPLVSGSPDGGLLSGVACTSAERCWAVGAIEPVPNGAGEPLGTATAHPYAGGGEPLIERYSAGSWEVVSGPTAVSGEELSAIDCVSSTDECYAVGLGLAEVATGP
jgi:hypothetical protein